MLKLNSNESTKKPSEEPVQTAPTTLTIENTDELKKDINPNLLKERTINNLKIKTIDILAINHTTTFKATVENLTNQTCQNIQLDIVFITEDGTECGRIEWPIALISANGSTNIDICVTQDLSMASDIILSTKSI